MSFEKHPVVAAFLTVNSYTAYPLKADLYHAIAYALYEKLTKYEEQEALDNAESVDPLPMLYKLLNSAAAKGDTQIIDVASKAIQRLNNFN